MELVVLCGLQASGKSTFRRERFANHTVVSKDLMSGARREPRQRLRIDAALARGESVVVDNTNPTPLEREPLCAIGRTHGALNVAYFFEPDLDVSLERNARRVGRACVPDFAVTGVAQRLERPTLDEGFDMIWSVRSAGGSFDVRQVEP